MAFGIESADDTILTSMRKRITVAQIEKALKLCHNEAIPFTGILIFGDINETFASATNSLDFWEAHREYNLGLQFITTYPGSYLYKYAKKEGIIKDAAQFLRDGCPMINVSKMTDDEISQIAKRIFTLSFNSQRQLESVHIKKLSRMSGISLTGICPYCGKEVIKEDVRMLVNCNWIACNNCGNKFLVGMVPEQIKEINASIENLLKRHAKIALWGITVHTLALFEKNDLYADKNIFFIDNSEMKRKLVIHEKPVLPPSILSSGEIEAVVFCYPNSFDMLRIQTLKEYLSINEFINILDLLEYDD
jgi:DNA-directed RNA polymerase subunit RPC12/RpoP